MADPSLDASGWKLAASGDDVFHGRIGYAWMRALVTASTAPSLLHFESVDDNATVYLNGKLLGSHTGWSDDFDVPVSTAWNAGGPNTVAVLVQNTAGAGGINGPMTVGFHVPKPAASTVDFDDLILACRPFAS